MISAMARLRIPAAFLFCLLPGVAASQVMTAYLNHLNIIPLEDPYCSPGTGRYLGPDPASLELCTAVSVSAIPPATGTVDAWRGVIDWVLIELRETSGDVGTARRNTIIARKPGFLLSNGRIVEAAHYARLAPASSDQCTDSPLVSDEHCPGVWFDDLTPAEDKNTYVIIRHRNHLDIISAQPVTVDAAADVGVYVYDFSADVRSALNHALKKSIGFRRRGDVGIVPVAVMVTGDYDGDGSIRLADDFGQGQTDIGMAEYHVADLNLNGTVHVEDFINYVSANIGLSSGIPF